MLFRPGPADPLILQRVDASASLSVGMSAGRTRISRLHQAGAAKIRLPRVWGDPLEAILINTAGGLTGGDRIDWSVDVGPGAAATLTSQACEKLYRSAAGHAEVDVRLAVRDGGSLAWLPQETIAYEASSLRRCIEADLDPAARLLMTEAVIFGRHAMGETVSQATLRDSWRIRVGGRLVHAESLRMGPDLARLRERQAGLGGSLAIASVLLVGPDAGELLDEARGLIGKDGGVSAWTAGGSGKLLARLACRDGLSLRRRLVPLLALLNKRADLPKAWSL